MSRDKLRVATARASTLEACPGSRPPPDSGRQHMTDSAQTATPERHLRHAKAGPGDADISASLAVASEAMVWPESEAVFWERTGAFELEAYPHPEIEGRIAHAVRLSQLQDRVLTKAQESLERMQALAILAQQAPSPQRGRSVEEFESLAAELGRLAAGEIEGAPLFGQRTVIVDLDATGNKLIMAGIDLDSEAFRAAIAADLSRAANAARALAHLKTALNQLAIHQAIVAANLNRLSFISKHLDVIKEQVQASAAEAQPPEALEGEAA